MTAKKAAAPSISVRPNALEGLSVMITGEIEGHTRASANKILEKAGATIEKSLNRKVQLVVLGKDAGPKKLDKIHDMGTEMEEWDDLIERIKADSDEESDSGVDIKDEGGGAEEEAEEKPKAKAKDTAKAKANTKANAKPAPKRKATTSTPASGSSIAGKTVIITGTVPGHDRKSAIAIVGKAGAKVARSLNKQVEIAILATNAGPDKLKTIEDQGIETMQWTDLAEELDLEVPPEKEVADVEAGKAPDSIDGMTLLMTGTVEGHTRASAEKLLKGAGAKFARSVTQAVELVVLGTQPGPDKLNQIDAMKIPAVKFEDLIKKLGLDKKSDEPPKKKTKKT